MRRFLILVGLLLPSAGLAATLTYTYDRLGRLTGVSYDNGIEVSYSYDPMGNRTNKSVILPPGLDSDGDGIPDLSDACPFTPNDPVGDPCNPDEDGDGFPDETDICPLDPVHDLVGDPCNHNDCPDGSLRDGVGDPCLHESAGDLDVTFGDGGRVTTDIGDAFSTVSGIAIQPDGKIIGSGSSDGDFALVRYDASGGLDPGFGTGGFVSVDLCAGSRDSSSRMLLQPDGKIVQGGYTNCLGDYDFVAVRYDTTGDPDPTFGSGGVAVIDIPGRVFSVAHSLALQPDGKIVQVGFSEIEGDPSARDFTVVRYNTDGGLDAGFGDGGVVLTNISEFPSPHDEAFAVAIQPDGRIVVAGNSRNDLGQHDISLVRYLPDGGLDTSFDADGKVMTRVGPGYATAGGVVFQGDGKILVAGNARNEIADPNRVDVALVRYNADGSLDAAFGSGGIVLTDLGRDYDVSRGLLVQPDGRIVLSGTSGALIPGTGSFDDTTDFAVIRYLSDGSLDMEFGSGGWVTTDFFGRADIGRDVALQPDGLIVVGGHVVIADGRRIFGLARYHSGLRLCPDGSFEDLLGDPCIHDAAGDLDMTFDSDGRVNTSFGDGVRAFGIDAALQDDGRIVMSGSANGDCVMARYETNGGLDATFGTGGVLTADYGGRETGCVVAVQPDEKILLAGTTDLDGDFRFVVARYNGDGATDATFGAGGSTIVTLPDRSFHVTKDIAVQMDGKIVLAGFTRPPGGGASDTTLVRFNIDGTLDDTFGTGGFVVNSTSADSDSFYAVLVQPDGKIVAGGESRRPDREYDLLLVRTNPDGSPDSAFGSEGIVITSLGPGTSYAFALALQADGKILAGSHLGGSVFLPPSGEDFAVLRYNPDGALDPAFDGDGIVTTDFGKDYERVSAIAVQADGAIVAGGWSGAGLSGPDFDFAIARYAPDGLLDPTFGSGGLVTTDFFGDRDWIRGLLIQPDGLIVAVGPVTPVPGTLHFGLARYLGVPSP